jgi:hypothetical protein
MAAFESGALQWSRTWNLVVLGGLVLCKTYHEY